MGACFSVDATTSRVLTVCILCPFQVQRCIWKLVNKSFPDKIAQIDVGGLLVCISQFLGVNPATIDPVTEEEDIPTRTMRTLVAALVKAKGADIKRDVDALGADPYNTPGGQMLLKIMARAGIPLPDVTSSEASGKLSPDEQEERLVQIFAMITSKEETKAGMEALYDFKLHNPDADTDKFLQTTSPFFQNHIRRCLADIKRTREEKRPSTSGAGKSAASYLDRLRQLTVQNTITSSSTGNASLHVFSMRTMFARSRQPIIHLDS